VTLVDFANDGKRLGTVQVDRIVRTDAQWRKQLSPLSYEVTRHAATERAFTGSLLGEHRKGVFRCICCDTALYDSATKFESGTGWPSFYEPADADAVETERDWGLLMPRTEVHCGRCGGHLGHVFNDGPHPTGLRYCINSCALDLEPDAGE
jgi:peptide-methionine (R)-S-oxide reductase